MWRGSVVSVRVVPPGAPFVGSRILRELQFGNETLHIEHEVTRFEPHRILETAILTPPWGRMSYRIEESSSDGCTVHFHGSGDWSGQVGMGAGELKAKIQRDIRRDLHRMKVLLECERVR